MTDMEKSQIDWIGDTGYIDETLLNKYIDDVAKPIYYLAGPAVMVSAMRNLLVKMGADEDNIKTEEFSGY
jgi:Na+-transporting NADH:ubiquinone oxidoreductase subunit NqrF